MPDFNDANKLGSGKEMVERLTNLIAIFENKPLDFSKNRAEGDDILGDAYEYLMRHFATESGKSKGQFYTPAEVSRIMAQIIGIREAKTSADTTVYDPTCGSGSLLLKVGDEARTPVTLYGQEKDAATSGLARMNMILHNNPTALIVQGNTLADPKFKDGDTLKTFDYVVANPPFSDKRWSTGLDPLNDPYERFQALRHAARQAGRLRLPAAHRPLAQEHRQRAPASCRTACCSAAMPRPTSAATCPQGLHQGHHRPARQPVLRHRHPRLHRGHRQGGRPRPQGHLHDRRQRRLHEGRPQEPPARPGHPQIVDVFNKQLDVPKYARMVSVDEIEKNDFNLNLPRYIDSQQAEDLQDIEGHLKGGIPTRMSMRSSATGTSARAPANPVQGQPPRLSSTWPWRSRPSSPRIYEHPEFAAFIARMNAHFATWREKTAKKLRTAEARLPSEGTHRRPGRRPARPLRRQAAHRQLRRLSAPDGLLGRDHAGRLLPDRRRWLEGRDLPHHREGQEGQGEGQGLDLRPCAQVPHRRPLLRQGTGSHRASSRPSWRAVTARLAELEEEHGGEEGAFSELDKVNKANVAARLKELQRERKTDSSSSFPRRRESSTSNNLDARFHGHDGAAAIAAEAAAPYGDDSASEMEALLTWLKLNTEEADLKKHLKEAETALDAKAYAKYPTLTKAEIKTLVVDDKWLAALDAAIHGEMDRVSQQLTQRVKELAERYDTPMPQMVANVADLEAKVNCHLNKMGFSWK